MKIEKITSLNRLLDPNYPTNLAIMVLMLVVMIAGGIISYVTGLSAFQSGLWGVRAGLIVFFAWALCRELDPDHNGSAFVAASLAVAALFFWDRFQFLALLWVLFSLRSLIRSTGLKATTLDSLAVLGLGGWLAFQTSWVYGGMTMVFFLMDAQLAPQHRRQLVFSALAAVVTVLAMIINGLGMETWSPVPIGIALAVVLIYFPVIFGSRSLKSVGDETGETLYPVRLQISGFIIVSLGVLIALLKGTESLLLLMPLWAAVVGAGLFRFFVLLRGVIRR